MSDTPTSIENPPVELPNYSKVAGIVVSPARVVLVGSVLSGLGTVIVSAGQHWDGRSVLGLLGLIAVTSWKFLDGNKTYEAKVLEYLQTHLQVLQNRKVLDKSNPPQHN
jgi:hypothetical protein